MKENIQNANIAELFGKHLKTLRSEKNLSQKDLASELQIPVSTYANWEQGRREPCLADIIRLLAVLEVNATELFDIF